jgi:hypothetical protein
MRLLKIDRYGRTGRAGVGVVGLLSSTEPGVADRLAPALYRRGFFGRRRLAAVRRAESCRIQQRAQFGDSGVLCLSDSPHHLEDGLVVREFRTAPGDRDSDRRVLDVVAEEGPEESIGGKL